MTISQAVTVSVSVARRPSDAYASAVDPTTLQALKRILEEQADPR